MLSPWASSRASLWSSLLPRRRGKGGQATGWGPGRPSLAGAAWRKADPASSDLGALSGVGDLVDRLRDLYEVQVRIANVDRSDSLGRSRALHRTFNDRAFAGFEVPNDFIQWYGGDKAQI